MSKNSTNISLGIDGITCSVVGKLVQKEQFFPIDAEHPLLHIKPKGNNTEVAIILPRFVRDNNSIGFGTKDANRINDVIDQTNKILKHCFKRDTTDLVVRSVEVALTIDMNIVNETLTNNLVSFMSRILLDAEMKTESNKSIYSPQNKYVSGKRRKGYIYIKDEIVKSFETSTLSNKRMKIKCYSKGANSSFGGESSVFRLEFVFNERGIRYITKKEDVRLSDILDRKMIKKFIEQYKQDYMEIVAPKIRGFLRESVRIIYDSFKDNKKVYDVLLLNKDIIYDIAVYEKALKKYYKLQNKTDTSYRKMISRIRNKLTNETDIYISDGMIDLFENITKFIQR